MASGIIPRMVSDEHNLGDAVYLTLNQEYTTPSNGYVVVTSSTTSGSYVRCWINDTIAVTVTYSGVSGVSNQEVVFVKKGMVLKMSNTASGGAVYFAPLI